MPCSEFENLSGCGNCFIVLSDKDNMSKLTSSSVSIVLNNIILLCNSNTDKKLLLQETAVKCDGTIRPKFNTNNKHYEINYNRNICTEVLMIWFKSHENEIDNSMTVVYLTTVLSTLLSDRPDNQLLRSIDSFSNVSTAIDNILAKR